MYKVKSAGVVYCERICFTFLHCSHRVQEVSQVHERMEEGVRGVSALWIHRDSISLRNICNVCVEVHRATRIDGTIRVESSLLQCCVGARCWYKGDKLSHGST